MTKEKLTAVTIADATHSKGRLQRIEEEEHPTNRKEVSSPSKVREHWGDTAICYRPTDDTNDNEGIFPHIEDLEASSSGVDHWRKSSMCIRSLPEDLLESLSHLDDDGEQPPSYEKVPTGHRKRHHHPTKSSLKTNETTKEEKPTPDRHSDIRRLKKVIYEDLLLRRRKRKDHKRRFGKRQMVMLPM
jgi:hypothetical protein